MLPVKPDKFQRVTVVQQQVPQRLGAGKREDWIDHPEYSSLKYRMDHYEEMEKRVEQVISSKPTQEWLYRFKENQVAAGPINTIEEMFDDPQFQALDMITSITHTTAGPIDVIRPPFTLSETPAEVSLAPPALGEHTTGVLSAAGFSEDEIESLIQKGIVEAL